MPVQIFNLRGVPEDEAEEVRQLLRDHAIDFYETPPGNWGISIPALWLRQGTEQPRAQQLITEYQAVRARAARQRYAREQQAGQNPGLLDQLAWNPLRSILYIACILLILYISLHPFLRIE